MFHVELILSGLINKGKRVSLFLFLFLISCGVARQKTEISDYLILDQGKSNVGNKSLNAFVFENSQRRVVFQQYISTRFKTNTFSSRELWINISGDHYKLLFYDTDEFDKYFGLSNFTVINQETEANTIANASKFIAISVINSNNEDVLSEESLSRNIVITYLKNLKDDYLINNGSF